MAQGQGISPEGQELSVCVPDLTTPENKTQNQLISRYYSHSTLREIFYITKALMLDYKEVTISPVGQWAIALEVCGLQTHMQATPQKLSAVLRRKDCARKLCFHHHLHLGSVADTSLKPGPMPACNNKQPQATPMALIFMVGALFVPLYYPL